MVKREAASNADARARSNANLKPIKKGEVRNPHGRRAHKNFKLTHTIRNLTVQQVAEIAIAVVSNNLDAMREIRADPNSSVLKVWIASVAIKGISKGDMSSLNMLLDRIVGKPKEFIQLSGDNVNPVRLAAQQMTPEERATELERLRMIREKAGGD